MDPQFPKGMLEEIESFLADDSKREPGKDIYPEVFSSNLFFPLQRQRELVAMIQEARAINPRTVMEIGTDKGGGLYYWCKCIPTVDMVLACEIRGTPYSKAFEKAFPHIDFLWMPYDSRTDLAKDNVRNFLRLSPKGSNTVLVPESESRKIDVLFIDGEKAFFKEDFHFYLPFMSPNGIVFMHDIKDSTPKKAFDELAKKYRHKRIIDTSDSMGALEREANGIHATCPHERWLRYWGGTSCGVGVLYMQK